jgi:DnaJ homologue, subfamily C, member 28, conserved domain
MTERKPREISFASWIDQQIAEAADRGAFDNLPGAGKPIPRRGGIDAWLQDYLRREGASADELLPAPLRLRKEAERLAETVGDLNSEDEVREVVRDLNRRIVEWRRIPTGPPVYLRLVDEAAMVARWRDARHRPSAPPPAARPHAASDPDPPSPRRRWWRRPALRSPRPAVRTVAVTARRTRAGWRSARRPAAPRRRGRGWAGRHRRRPRG